MKCLLIKIVNFVAKLNLNFAVIPIRANMKYDKNYCISYDDSYKLTITTINVSL